MAIIMNEREFAENAIKSRTLGDKPAVTLMNIAKYYRASGYRPREISNMLNMFIRRCDPNINQNTWSDTIDWCVKHSKNKSLIEIDSVLVTKAEIEICDSLPRPQLRRLMFTLICLAKFNDMAHPNNCGWINKPDKDIFALANIITPVRRQSLALNELMNLGLIGFSKKIDNIGIRVCCLSKDSEPAVIVTDMRNLGYQYQRYCGAQIIECEACGLVIPKKSNRQKYCSYCAPEINLAHAKMRS